MKILSTLIAILTLAGCAASGPIYQQYIPAATDASVIYIYRPNRAVNCCVAPAVYLNGEQLGPLKNGGYLAYELTSGQHEITVGDGSYGFEPQTIKLQSREGDIHYLKWIIGALNQFDAMIVGGVGVAYATRDYHLIEIPTDKAKHEIASLKLSQP